MPLLVGLALVAGCSSSPEKPKAPQPQSGPSQPSSSIPVEKLESAYQTAATEYETAKTEANKALYVDATVAYATGVMAADGPPAKYQKSLKLYNEALRLDPENEEAKTNRQLILDIYKSMGKEPPK